MPGSKKILIVEDYADIATIYSFMLKKYGYDVQIAPDGPSALALTKSFAPDIILLDIMIPDIDGLTVLKTIRTDPEYQSINPKILVMSNLMQPDIEAKAEQYGADGYVVKANVQNNEVVAIIRELVERTSDGDSLAPTNEIHAPSEQGNAAAPVADPTTAQPTAQPLLQPTPAPTAMPLAQAPDAIPTPGDATDSSQPAAPSDGSHV